MSVKSATKKKKTHQQIAEKNTLPEKLSE